MEINEEKGGMGQAPPVIAPELPARNDREFAGILKRTLEGKALYVPEIKGGWMVFDGIRWRQDDSKQILHLAGQVVDQMMRDTAGLDIEQGEKARRMAEITKMANRNRLENAVVLLQPLLKAPIATFDVDPWIIGTPSGMVDLRTGQFMDPDPDARITKAVAVDLDPNATCPQWLEFLHTIFDGDDELIEFMRRSVGYALTAHSTEHYLWFAYGHGANGKSTFFETILALLGDYAVKTSNKLFFNRKQGQEAEQEIAALKGARFVVGEELEAGEQLAEARVKSITGGDTLSGRWLHGRPFPFRPTHSTWMYGNYRPTVYGTGISIWRRMLLIPFTVTIPDEKQQKHFFEKVLRKELPGIFAWAVGGTQAWKKHGIEIPKVIKETVNEYKKDEDILREFTDDWIVEDEHSNALFMETYMAYRSYAACQGIYSCWTQKFLNRLLRDRGWKEKRTSRGNVWIGRRVKKSYEPNGYVNT